METPFIEMVTGPPAQEARFRELTGILSDPPDALAALISWEVADQPGVVTTVLVWDSPAARGDWSAAKIMPLIQSGQLEPAHPNRLTPVEVYVRDQTDS